MSSNFHNSHRKYCFPAHKICFCFFAASNEVLYYLARTGCKTPGCRGTGHVRGHRFSTHHTAATCPYAPENLDNDSNLPDRFQGNEDPPR
jgi:hypothetical protein